MANPKPPQLTLEDLERRFGPGADLEPDLSEDLEYTDIDTSAPDGKKTVCANCSANEIESRLKRRLPNHRALRVLTDKLWDEATTLIQQFLGRQEWKGIDYIENAREADILREKLVNFQPKELSSLETLLPKIRKEVFGNSRSSLLMFTPKFRLWDYKGKTRKFGQFVKIFMTKEMRFLRIPFLLGLEAEKFHYLPGCRKCIRELRYLTLESGKKEMLQEDNSPVLNRTGKQMYYFFLKAKPVQTYEDACQQEKKLAEIVRLNPNPFANADSQAEKEMDSQSYFAIALDIFTPELLGEISQPGLTPKEITELILQVLREKTPEEIGKVKILLGKKRGDPNPNGMPGGLGLPGGSLDPEETPHSNHLDFKSILPPSLYKRAEQDPLFKEKIQRTCDELINRTGFEARMVIGQVYLFLKEREGKIHGDNYLFIATPKMPTQPIFRTNKMVANPGQQWYTLEEYFEKPVGSDRIPRSERPNFPFFSNLKIILSIFEQHKLPLSPAMARFLNQQIRR